MTEQEILNEAFAAARAATEIHLQTHGDRDCCGFAWVVLRPGNCKLAKVAKQLKLAQPGYGEPGVTFWNPSKHPTQCITAKEEGAVAFANVLQKYGYKAYASSRLD